jgi:ornithine cyclodeaminase/alanine dehydrogenase-like protein (mu-crystallin family)
MTSPALQLDTDELLSALDAINPLDVVREELISKAAGGTGWSPERDARLAPWHRGTSVEAALATELLLLEDLRVGGRCLLPKSALYVLRTASLTALAARELVVPGVVTAAMLGFDFTAQSSLGLIARYLPGLSHVAICPIGDGPNEPNEPRGAGGAGGMGGAGGAGEQDRPNVPSGLNRPDGPMAQRVIDQLDLDGVGWSVTPALTEAVFGANLIVATVASMQWLEIGHLAKGAVLINTTGKDLPDHVVGAVDQIYVDDAALIDRNPHRYFARMHMTERDNGPVWGRAGVRRYRHVEADFAELLTGAHPGRTHVDHVLLVELLGVQELDVRLACALHRAALEQGLGVWLIE